MHPDDRNQQQPLQPYQPPTGSLPHVDVPPLPEEHPFIEPRLDYDKPSGSGVPTWLNRRVIAIFACLILVLGAGVGLTALFGGSNGSVADKKNTGEEITNEYGEELYEGDGSDIAATTTPTSDWECPEGATSSGEGSKMQCTFSTEDIIEPKQSTSCPSGYTKIDDGSATKCQKPSGSTRTIVVNATATHVCPSGYTKSGTSCQKTQTSAASTTYSCPSGYTKVGSGTQTKCQRSTMDYTTVIAQCPAGYVKSGSGASSTCKRTIDATANTTYSCPSGYVPSGSGPNKVCTRTINPTNGSCPSGYTKVGSGSTAKCKRTINALKGATYSCPSGYTKTGSGSSSKCVRSASPTLSCPSGYAKSGSGTSTTCSRIVVTTIGPDVYKVCPSGYKLDGNECKKTVTQPTTVSYSCSAGYTRSGSKCIKYVGGTFTSTKPIVKLSCSDGYKLDGNECKKTTKVTEPAEYVYHCEDGWELLDVEGSSPQCVKSDE